MLDTNAEAGADAAQTAEGHQGEGAPREAESQLGGGAGAPEGGAPAEGEGQPKGDGADKPAVTKQPWAHKRIDDLTAQRYEQQRRADAAERERDELRQRIAAFERAQNGQGEQPPQDGQDRRQPAPQTQADIDRMVAERASELRRTEEFNSACNRVHAEGIKAYPDFGEALGNFRMLGGLPPALIEAAIETDNAAGVLYQLGKDPDEAQRILALSPTRMAVAVAKLAAKPAPQPAVSKAPTPITPVRGGSRADPNPDTLSTAEWIAARRDGKIK